VERASAESHAPLGLDGEAKQSNDASLYDTSALEAMKATCVRRCDEASRPPPNVVFTTGVADKVSPCCHEPHSWTPLLSSRQSEALKHPTCYRGGRRPTESIDAPAPTLQRRSPLG
jgi:hypothetical protein